MISFTIDLTSILPQMVSLLERVAGVQSSGFTLRNCTRFTEYLQLFAGKNLLGILKMKNPYEIQGIRA